MFPISLITFLHKLLSIPKSPPPCASQQLPAFIFWSQNFPLCLSAIFCMYLHVSSFSFNVMSQQLFPLIRFQYQTFASPYVPLNFLRPFRFIRKLPSIGLSTISYVFVVSISKLPLHQQLLACILSQCLNSPHPVPGPKKHVQVQKKKVPRSKNIQPNVSAYNNGVPPHPMEARSMKQVHGSKKQKPRSETINLAV